MTARRLRATLTRACASEDMAGALLRSLAPDNGRYATATVEGKVLTLRVEAATPGELRRTMDDLLACLSTAEKVWAKASPIRDDTRSARRPTP